MWFWCRWKGSVHPYAPKHMRSYFPSGSQALLANYFTCRSVEIAAVTPIQNEVNGSCCSQNTVQVKLDHSTATYLFRDNVCLFRILHRAHCQHFLWLIVYQTYKTVKTVYSPTPPSAPPVATQVPLSRSTFTRHVIYPNKVYWESNR